MKLFAFRTITLGIFTLAVSLLPMASVSAAAGTLNHVKEIEASSHVRHTLTAREASDMLNFEGFEGQLNRYLDLQESYYLFTVYNSDFHNDGLNPNSFTVLGQEALQDSLLYNEDNFQTLIFSGSGNEAYAKGFADIIRLEAAYFVSVTLLTIAGDAAGVAQTLTNWYSLAPLYGHYFGQFQPNKPNLPADIELLAAQMRDAQFNEAVLLGNSFKVGHEGNLTAIIADFNTALSIMQQIIHKAVPRD